MSNKTLKINISGMTCVNCSNAVEKVTKKLPGVEGVNVSFASSKGEFVYDANLVNEDEIISKIKRLGYGVTADAKALEEAKTKELLALKNRLVVAGIITVIVMFLHKTPILGDLTIYLTFVLASIVQFYSGAPFYRHAYGALANKNYDMNVLVALGTTAAYGYSVAVMLFGKFFPETMRFDYFDGAVMIIAFVSLGKYLEERSKSKATDALKKLMDLSPKNATLLKDGKESEVLASSLKPEDIVIVKSGEGIPCDGIIIEGDAEIDTSMITGEPLPVHKSLNEEVVAGTILKTGFIKIKVTKFPSQTLLSTIVSLLSEAQNQKMPIGRIADRVSNIFVPSVIFISIITLFSWWFISGNTLVAFLASVSVLIISCPCALGLATPIAIVSAVGKGASMGILLKNPEVLEIMKDVKYAVFDKTGTLTKGEISVSSTSVESVEDLRLIAQIEARSEHPISKAVLDYVKNSVSLSSSSEVSVKVIPGRGIEGAVEGKTILIGSVAFLSENGVKVSAGTLEKMQEAQDEGKGAIVASIDGKEVGYFALEDSLKEEAKDLILELKKSGITPIMLTGDNEKTAKNIANKLGIETIFAEVLPQEKLEKIKELQKKGRVLFVGDGINDSLSLKQADIGIALNSGSDIAKDAGDIVLIGNDLTLVQRALNLSRRTMRTIKQNLFWAFIYNIIGIPLAAGALYPTFGLLLTPKYAGMAMSISSVTVVLNALRLKLAKL
ncbi:MAG: heavy metal translocating P-type ATPase [Campylobacterales bacterium]|nr:heavy metal translocating P-type ATPase [Campylobacterales bacterium]